VGIIRHFAEGCLICAAISRSRPATRSLRPVIFAFEISQTATAPKTRPDNKRENQAHDA